MKKIKKVLIIFSAGVLSSLIVGCATQRSSADIYTHEQTQRAQNVEFGIVAGLRNVKIKEKETKGVGTLAGGVLGGVIGHQIGKKAGFGKFGRNVWMIGGVIGGGMAGDKAEEKIKTVKGLEITIQLDSGKNVVIVQEADIKLFNNQRVRVINDGRIYRVTPI